MKVIFTLHEVKEISDWAQDQSTSVKTEDRCIDIVITEEATILIDPRVGVISSRPPNYFK